MTVYKADLDRRFPLPKLRSQPLADKIAQTVRADTLLRAVEELETVLSSDDALYRPSLALLALANMVMEWRMLVGPLDADLPDQKEGQAP
mgnify:FL=1